ncbi:hypothetical protein SDC9_104142 [bioreactor metagenome]|uniref:Uncharacterized protein n=1 Tax=bioreactor metagenome TaxID=1076179 RepID=A0A645AVY6_9ZZZZ
MVQIMPEVMHQQTRGDKLPAGRFLRGQLRRCADEHRAFCPLAHLRLEERAEFFVQPRELIAFMRIVLLYLGEHGLQRVAVGKEFADAAPLPAHARALAAVENIALALGVVALLHERFFHKILNLFHLHRRNQLPHTLFHRAGNLVQRGLGDLRLRAEKRLSYRI